MFKAAFKYFFAGPWTEAALMQRGLNVSEKLIEKGANISPSQAASLLKDLGPVYFQKCYGEYFAIAKYPAIAERFPITLGEVLG